MAEKKRKKGNGILFGLILLGASIVAIWKNEHRFDYHKAARDTTAVDAIAQLSPGDLFSHTGSMDRELTLEGRYVRSFQGYLEVRRSAEIYAWDRDEDDDGVTWSKKWMSHLENNERNEGLRKKLQSDTIAPSRYAVAELVVDSSKIQFVDPSESIPSADLTLTRQGSDLGLAPRDDYFYLIKGNPDQLGDERISYRGIPVPEVATYFGRWENGRAVAHQAEVKEGFISDIIQDKGILHHLVAGPRDTALASIKAHLARVKTIVRIIALVLCTIGGGILFSSLTRLLVFIPIVGPLMHRVTGWIGLLVGFGLGLLTLAVAFVTSKPVILAIIAVVIAAGLVMLAVNAGRRRGRIRERIAGSLGHPPSRDELAELEFIQLRQLAAWNGTITPDEQRQLDRWTARNGWSPEKVSELVHRAERESGQASEREKLEALIRYSLADGRIDRKELKTLQTAASWAGIGKKGLGALMNQVQSG